MEELIKKIETLILEREKKQAEQDARRWCRCKDCERWIGEDYENVVNEIKSHIEEYKWTLVEEEDENS